MLVALSLPIWQITYVSLNAAELFGKPVDAMIGASMEVILPPKIIHDLRNTFQAAMISGQAERLSGVRIGTEDAEHDIFIHASGNYAVAECLPVAGADTIRSDAAVLVKTIIERLRRTGTFTAFMTSAARQLRAVTGFDRVLIQEFLEDGSGTVVVEASRPGMPSCLGLHSPATDIPARSRALLLRQRLRMIPDSEGAPVPIEPASTAEQLPLDLSLSMLRPASPIHLRHLREMGVRASLTASIIQGDELWGLISCHHETPRRIAASTATAIELLAQMFSTMIEGKRNKDELVDRVKARETHDRLIAGMAPQETIFQDLAAFAPTLREMIRCDGVGVWSEGRFEFDGLAPPADAMPELTRFLDHKPADRCFATNELSSELPDASRYAGAVSGLLALPFSRVPKDYVLLFRRGSVRTVARSDHSDEAAPCQEEPGGPSSRIPSVPRQEAVRSRSPAWRPFELEIAETLRISLLDVVLRRLDLINREHKIVQQSRAFLIAR